MKKIQPNESDFSRIIRDSFDGWVERVEPGRGSNPGFPDLIALLPSGLEFIELKCATVEDGVLWPSEIRPAQIAWHKRIADSGYRSLFLCGVWMGDRFAAYAFDGLSAAHYETTGFRIGETCFEIDMNNLYDSLSDYVFEQLEL